jgi:PAS domain S-box-containing protein
MKATKNKTKTKSRRDLVKSHQRTVEVETSVTASKRVEAAYQAIIRTAMDGFWITDMQGHFLDINDAYCRLIGHDREKLLTMKISDMEAVEKPEETARHIRRVLETGGDRFQTQHRTKDGKIIDLEVSVNYTKVAGGRLFVFLRDITERKRNEDELEKHRMHLEELVKERTAELESEITERKRAEAEIKKMNADLEMRNKLAEIFLTVTDDNMYFEVLQYILKITDSKFGVFGYIDKNGALIVPSMSRYIWDKCNIPDKDAVFPREKWGDSSWPRAIREKKPNYTNLPSAKMPEGHITVTKHISFPIIYKGEVIGLFQVANREKDYTDKDLGALQFISNIVAPILNARLQRDRQEKARRMAEESLKKAVTDLERSNKELEQFAYVASHDLQEPLRMVASFTQLLEKRYKDKLDPDAGEYIKYAVEGANRMQQLINDLLTFSRLGTRGRPFESCDCQSVLGKVIANFRRVIDENQALITNDDLPVIMADETQMIQLFQNLIGNAIKFRRKDSPRVHISARKKADEWIFSVRDNGIGIDPQYKERIFIIFQRLHDKEKYTGTGIGLAICKRVVERHGGRIWMESELDKGSTFYFTIPERGLATKEK